MELLDSLCSDRTLPFVWRTLPSMAPRPTPADVGTTTQHRRFSSYPGEVRVVTVSEPDECCTERCVDAAQSFCTSVVLPRPQPERMAPPVRARKGTYKYQL